ncbi:MAG TPA: RDD family protein [Pseudonocardiaceae bacterium]
MTLSSPSPAGSIRPAGIVTRLAAAAVDVAVVAGMLLVGYAGVAGVMFFWSPYTFRWPTPSFIFSLFTAAVLATAYLALEWATTGRSYGTFLLGLRVLGADGGRLGWPRATLRAALCVVFPAGLLWVAISPRRRSIQDILLRSIVVYDWEGRILIPDRRRARFGAPLPAQAGPSTPSALPQPPEEVERDQ